MNPISVDPKTTSRAQAFELWMNAPNPMVTFFKTLDVSPLVRLSHRRKLKFNMLLCWCVGKAASEVKEFFLLPVGGELLKYDSLAVNTIVKNKSGEVSSCDVPFNDDIEKFNCDYLELTSEVVAADRLKRNIENRNLVLLRVRERLQKRLPDKILRKRVIRRTNSKPIDFRKFFFCHSFYTLLKKFYTSRKLVT